MSTCFIVGAGDCKNLGINKKDGDLIIAADAGYQYLKNKGLTPDVVIGDFDSAPVPAHKNVIKLKVEKDETDMEMCMRHGIKEGFINFVIFGGLGGKRIAHTIANLQMICNYTKQGYNITMVGDETMITAIYNDYIVFPKGMKGDVSVFAHGGDVNHVSIEGLKYEVRDVTLTSDFALGVSNSFIDKEARISVEDGVLIIMWSVQK
ncbi:thiamine diphosphokinase [uncultured Eubacterium sp.]|uniref:thiamine diphosphokinase n=1 Tax=uncultured Eubacterium sp. TaxID=165185 RepID=UPI002598D37A|nr:thiamine diphosphokinase [uncultured Eubacterium sp.]